MRRIRAAAADQKLLLSTFGDVKEKEEEAFERRRCLRGGDV